MRDLLQIAEACSQARQSNVPLALATVAMVEGSAYRRPGARMLVFPDGRRIGSISGGCLEADVIERAHQAMTDGRPQYIRYDTRGENGDIVMELGCRGAVGILIERATDPPLLDDLKQLAAVARRRERGVQATLFRVEGARGLKAGLRLMRRADGTMQGDVEVARRLPALFQDLCAAPETLRPQARTYALPTGRAEALIEPLLPSPALLLCGAGQDAVPLAATAQIAGWQVSVADHRLPLLSAQRFPGAERLLHVGPEDLAHALFPDERTAAVLMTHSYARDREWLRRLLPLPLGYIGLLGPRRRAERLLGELQAEGISLSAAQRKRLHAPTGLDIGSETPEEIALAIVAEIQAVFNDRSGGFLQHRVGPIHTTGAQMVSAPTSARHAIPAVSCPLSA